MMANHVFWQLMPFYVYTRLLLLLQPSVGWLSVVNFNNDAKPPPKWILREFDVSRIGPRLGGLPLLGTFTWQNLTQLRGLPGLADRATCLCGSPHLWCKRDQIKMRDYMDRRVTPPKRVISPTSGAPPSYKQALNKSFCLIVTINVLYATKTTTRKKWTFKNMRRQFTQLRIAWVYSLSNPRGWEIL